MLSPHLDVKLNPFIVKTGTPMEILSKLVVTPGKGNVSSAKSILLYSLRWSSIFFVLSKIVVYGFLILLAYYGYLVLTLITGETLVTLEWVPQTFVQSVIPIGSCLFMLSESLRIPEDYRNLVLQSTDIEQTGDI